ncbi:MAG: 2-oxo acid dehydrogenase subunit E2, partial [Deltaproteobacteria bacterium]
RIKVSPLARRIAAERGVDLRTVAGSGPNGRIIKRDVADLEPTRRVAGAPALVREDTVVRVSQMRKTIAKRLVESKQSAPHYYLTMTIDADRLVSLRAEINAAQDRVKVSYNDLVLRACVVALQDHPEVNVAWEGTTIRQFAGVHLGFAVALDEGLISPVVRDADTLSLVDLGLQVRALAERARAQKLESAEYTGASFTVSNLGMYGIDHFTAVINPPGACILAVGALTQQPVVKDGQLAVGHRMTVTLSCDHRAVDGARGAAFLADLKAVLEAPLGLLL